MSAEDDSAGGTSNAHDQPAPGQVSPTPASGGTAGKRTRTEGLTRRSEGESAATSLVTSKGAGAGLDAQGSQLATRVGVSDPGEVRLHTGGAHEPELSTLGARAVTVGSDIFLGAGEYDSASPSGQRLLAHELTHVAQQSGASGISQAKLADPGRSRGRGSGAFDLGSGATEPGPGPGGFDSLDMPAAGDFGSASASAALDLGSALDVAPPHIEVGPAGDSFELEADRVADAVVAGQAPPSVTRGAISAQRAQRDPPAAAHAAAPAAPPAAPGGPPGAPATTAPAALVFGLNPDQLAQLRLKAAAVLPEWATAAGSLMTFENCGDQLPDGPPMPVFISGVPNEHPGVYELKYLGVQPGEPDFRAFLNALPTPRNSYKQAYQAMLEQVEFDHAQIDRFDQALGQMASGRGVNEVGPVLLGGFQSLGRDGRKIVRTPERIAQVSGMSVAAEVTHLKDTVLGLLRDTDPPDATPAALAAAQQAEDQRYTQLKAQLIAALPRARARAGAGHLDDAHVRAVSGIISGAPPLLRDRLYADADIQIALRERCSIQQLADFTRQLDTGQSIVDQIGAAVMHTETARGDGAGGSAGHDSLGGGSLLDILRPYCQTHDQPTRDRLMQNSDVQSYLQMVPEPSRSQAIRLIMTGSSEPDVSEQVHQALLANDDAGLATALIHLVGNHDASMRLRDTLSFHQALQAVTHDIDIGGVPMRPYDYMRQAWGLPPSQTLPGAPVQAEGNPDPDSRPLTPLETLGLDTFVVGYAVQMRRELDVLPIVGYVSDANVRRILTEYSDQVSNEAHLHLFRRAHMAPGPRLQEVYQRRYGSDMRSVIARRVSGGGDRELAERVLGIRLDSSTLDVGAPGGTDHSAPAAPGQPREHIDLTQALREVRTTDDSMPLADAIHACARTIYEATHRTLLRGDFETVRDAWFLMGRRINDKLAEVAMLTGQGQPYAIVLLQGAYSELGGPLEADLTDSHVTYAWSCRQYLGLTPEATTHRLAEGDAARERQMGLERARHESARALFTALENMHDAAGAPAVHAAWNATQQADPAGVPVRTPTMPADPDLAQSLNTYYRTEFGLPLTLHFGRTAQRVTSDPQTSGGKTRDQVLHDMGAPPGSEAPTTGIPVGVDELAIHDPAGVTPEFTPEEAHRRAIQIWDELQRPGCEPHLVADQLAGALAEEQRLILAYFRHDHQVDLRYYIQAAINRTAEYRTEGSGEDAQQVRVIHDGADQLSANSGDADRSRLLDLTREGGTGAQTSLLTRVQMACSSGRIDNIYAIIENASQPERDQIRRDPTTYAALRARCTHDYEWDRVFKGLTGTLDMVDILASRAHGRSIDGVGDLGHIFDTEDQDAMRRDIRAYFQRRRREVRAQVDADPHFAGGAGAPAASDDDKAAEVQRRISQEIAQIAASPSVISMLRDELGTGSELASVQSALVHGGTAWAEDSVLTGTDWSVDEAGIIRQLRAAPEAQRARMRQDPEFMRRLQSAMSGHPEDLRDALAAVYGTAPEGGDDHLAQLENLSRYSAHTLNQSNDIAHLMVQLSPAEIQRLNTMPALVSQILGECQSHPHELEVVQSILGVNLSTAPVVDGATAAQTHQAQLDNQLRITKELAIAKIMAGAALTWNDALSASVEIFNMSVPVTPDESAPGTPPATPAPEPASAAARPTDLFEKAGPGRLRPAAARHEVWSQVRVDVMGRLADTGSLPAGISRDRSEELLADAVLGAWDPSSMRIVEQMGTFSNDFEGLKSTLRGVSNELLVQQWATFTRSNPPPGGSGEETMQAAYARWVTARHEAQAAHPPQPALPPPSPAPASRPPAPAAPAHETAPPSDAAPVPTTPAPRQAPQPRDQAAEHARLLFARFVVDVSASFEGDVLQMTTGDTHTTTAAQHRAGTVRDNHQYLELKDIVRERLPHVPPQLVAEAIGADADPAALALIESPTRTAMAEFAQGREDYLFERGRDVNSDTNFGSQAAMGVSGTALDAAQERWTLARGEESTRAGHYGEIDAAGEARLGEARDAQRDARTAFTEAKAAAADMAAEIVGVLVTVLVTALTAGAAGPLMVALAGAVTGAASAAAESGVREMIQGGDYDWSSEGPRAILSGAVVGAISYAGGYYARGVAAHLAERTVAGRAVMAFAESIDRVENPFARVLLQSARSGVNNAGDTMVGGLARAAGALANPDDYRHGISDGWARARGHATTALLGVPGEMGHAFVVGFLQHGVEHGILRGGGHAAGHTEGTPGHSAEGAPGHTAEGTPGHPAEGAPGHTAEGTPGHTAEGTPGHTAEGTPGHTAEGRPPAPHPAEPGSHEGETETEPREGETGAHPGGEGTPARPRDRNSWGARVTDYWDITIRGMPSYGVQALIERLLDEETWRNGNFDISHLMEQLARDFGSGLRDSGMMYHRNNLVNMRRAQRAAMWIREEGHDLTKAEREAYITEATQGDSLAAAHPGEWVLLYRQRPAVIAAAAAAAARVAPPVVAGGTTPPVVAGGTPPVVAGGTTPPVVAGGTTPPVVAGGTTPPVVADPATHTATPPVVGGGTTPPVVADPATHTTPPVVADPATHTTPPVVADPATHTVTPPVVADPATHTATPPVVADPATHTATPPVVADPTHTTPSSEHVTPGEHVTPATHDDPAARQQRETQAGEAARQQQAAAVAAEQARQRRMVVDYHTQQVLAELDRRGADPLPPEQMARQIRDRLPADLRTLPEAELTRMISDLQVREGRTPRHYPEERMLVHALELGQMETLEQRIRSIHDAPANIRGSIEIYVTGGGRSARNRQGAEVADSMVFGEGDTLRVSVVVRTYGGAPPTEAQLAAVQTMLRGLTVRGRLTQEAPGARFRDVPVAITTMTPEGLGDAASQAGGMVHRIDRTEAQPSRPGAERSGATPPRAETAETTTETGVHPGATTTPPPDYRPIRTRAEAEAVLTQLHSWRAIREHFMPHDPASMQVMVDYREQWIDRTLRRIAEENGLTIGAMGSVNLTSDYDLQLSHAEGPVERRGNIGHAIAQANEAYRRAWGVESGTHLDTNVYDSGEAMNRMNRRAPDFVGTGEATRVMREANAQMQDVSALVMVRNQMGAGDAGDRTWQSYVDGLVSALPEAQQAAERARFTDAANQYREMRAQVETRARFLAETDQAAGITRSAADRELAANNELYATATAAVDEARARRDTMMERYRRRPTPELAEQLDRLTLEVRDLNREALRFANEAYFSEGAVQHVVGGQSGLDISGLSARQLLDSGNEQFAYSLHALHDTLREHPGDPARALVQASKYVERLVDAIWRSVPADQRGQCHFEELRAYAALLALRPQPPPNLAAEVATRLGSLPVDAHHLEVLLTQADQALNQIVRQTPDADRGAAQGVQLPAPRGPSGDSGGTPPARADAAAPADTHAPAPETTPASPEATRPASETAPRSEPSRPPADPPQPGDVTPGTRAPVQLPPSINPETRLSAAATTAAPTDVARGGQLAQMDPETIRALTHAAALYRDMRRTYGFDSPDAEPAARAAWADDLRRHGIMVAPEVMREAVPAGPPPDRRPPPPPLTDAAVERHFAEVRPQAATVDGHTMVLHRSGRPEETRRIVLIPPADAGARTGSRVVTDASGTHYEIWVQRELREPEAAAQLGREIARLQNELDHPPAPPAAPRAPGEAPAAPSHAPVGSAEQRAEIAAAVPALPAHEHAPLVAHMIADLEAARVRPGGAASAETQRMSTELDLMLYRLGVLQDGPQRQAALAAMDPESRRRIEAYLAQATIHVATPTQAADLSGPQGADATQQHGEASSMSRLPESTVLPHAPEGAITAYSAADLPLVLELRSRMATIQEMDGRLAQRDADGNRATTAALAQGDSIRRRESVARVRALLEALQLGGSDRGYIERRLAELERVFPGVGIHDALMQRVARREQVVTAHGAAQEARTEYEARCAALTATVSGQPNPQFDRIIVGDGMTAITDLGTLGVNGQPPPGVINIGMGNQWGARSPRDMWGQRAGVMDRTPLFGGNPEGARAGDVTEDPGEFMHLGELVDATDLARQRLQMAAFRGTVGVIEGRGRQPPGSEPWAHPERAVRIPVQSEHGIQYFYADHIDLTTGPGPARMPSETVMSASDRRTMLDRGDVVSGDEFLTRQEQLTGQIFIYGASPTGAWAATHATGHDATHVTWGHSTGSATSNARGFSSTAELDRTRDAFSDPHVVQTTNPVIGMRPGTPRGVEVTFFGSPTPGAPAQAYHVHFDQVVIAIGLDNAGETQTGATSGAPQLTGAGRLVGQLPMHPVQIDGLQATEQPPVLQSTDGTVRVLGAAAGQMPNVPASEQADFRRRQDRAVGELSADSPTVDTVEYMGNAVAAANQHATAPVVRRRRAAREAAVAAGTAQPTPRTDPGGGTR